MRTCRYQAAIVEDDRLLLVEHRSRETGRGWWVPPGGGIEAGESEEECVRREVREETSLDVEVARLLATHLFETERPYRESKTFLCRIIGGTPTPGMEPEHGDNAVYDISDVIWVSLSDPTTWPKQVTEDSRTAEFVNDIRSALGYA